VKCDATAHVVAQHGLGYAEAAEAVERFLGGLQRDLDRKGGQLQGRAAYRHDLLDAAGTAKPCHAPCGRGGPAGRPAIGPAI